MKEFASKHFWFLITFVYFFTRIVNLKIVPIFTDEAIYTYWAQIALNDPANRFVSLEDGKQPLFIWLAAIFQNFITDPLIASRLVSVFAGFGTTIGIYLLAKTLFNSTVAKFAAVLYVLLPFTLLYDRMALFDSLLTMLTVFSVYLAVRTTRELSLRLAVINGAVIGLAMLTKSSANFFLYLIPTTLLFLNISKKTRTKNIANWIFLYAVTGFIAMFLYNSLRFLTPLFFRISQKNAEFIRSPQEVLQNPLLHFFGNLDSILKWHIDYLGPILFIAATFALIWGFIKFNKSIITLAAYIFAPLLAELLFNEVLYPRFALFYFPYVILILSFGLYEAINKFKKVKLLVISALLIAFIWPIYSSFKLLTDPPNSLITKSDKDQFMNEWPAGYGVTEIIDLLKEETKNGKVYVGTEGTFGLLPFALQVYFYANNNINIVGYWPVREIPIQVMEESKIKKTYFVFNEKQDLPDEPNNRKLKLVGKYQKGNGNSYMRLYEVIP